MMSKLPYLAAKEVLVVRAQRALTAARRRCAGGLEPRHAVEAGLSLPAWAPLSELVDALARDVDLLGPGRHQHRQRGLQRQGDREQKVHQAVLLLVYSWTRSRARALALSLSLATVPRWPGER